MKKEKVKKKKCKKKKERDDPLDDAAISFCSIVPYSFGWGTGERD